MKGWGTPLDRGPLGPIRDELNELQAKCKVLQGQVNTLTLIAVLFVFILITVAALVSL